MDYCRLTASRIVPGIVLLLALAVVIVGCGGPGATRIDTVDAGRTLFYTPGVPNFDMEAIARWKGMEPGIDLNLGIPHISLIFHRLGDSYVAKYEVMAQIQDRRGRSMITQQVWSDTLLVDDYDTTQRYEAFHIDRWIALDPDEYLVEVTLRDVNSNKTAVRRQRLQVFEVGEAQPVLSQIQIEARRGDDPFSPLIALHIPSDLESMRAQVELYNATGSADVSMALIRLESDVSVASPPYWLTPMAGSLRYRGVNYSAARSDTIQTSHRRITDLDGEVSIEFDLPQLESGIYRIDVRAITDNGSEPIQERRDISVQGPEFPRVTTVDQLIEALAYIAYDREIRDIQAADTPEEKRRRFDAFWGSLVGSRQQANNLLRLYYGRVEEANLFFTSHKEGWKTDRGMVYIVMGAPYFVEHMFDTEVWYYTYSDRDPSYSFVFERVRPHGADAAFPNHLLVRRPFYERTWIRAIDRWRRGQVL